MRSYFVVFILLVQSVFVAFSSDLPRLLSFDDYVNAIYQRQNFTEEADFESIQAALQEAYATPLDLNQVTEERLAELGILSNNQIKNYFNHLAATGPLYSKYELQAIPDFDLTTIALLVPFVYVTESYHIPSKSLQKDESKPHSFLLRYAPPFGASDQVKRLGNLDKYSIQLSCNHQNDITWGITARKQAGESFCWDHATYRYGFNLWSIFVMVEKQGYLKKLIIGDYQIGYGQGLLFSAGYIHAGEAIASIIRSNNVGIRPYKAIRRIGLRGIALTSDLGPIELTAFYANHNLDATLQLNAQNQPYAHRIDCIGKYDTAHSLAKKGTIREQVIGGTIRKQYNRNQTEIGINLLYNHYDIPIIRKEADTDGYLLRSQSAVGLFYRLLCKNWLFFGEGVLTVPNTSRAKKGKGLITGCIISFSRYIDLSGAPYYYGKGLYTPYGNGFKRYVTDSANEQGGYAAFQVTPLPNWQITTRGHFFATLAPKPRLAIEGSGYCFVTRSSYIWNRATTLVVQHKLHKNPRNKPKEANHVPKIAAATQNSFKCTLDQKLTHSWWTHSEMQYTRYTFLGDTHHGYACGNTQKWKGDKWQFTCKAIYFKIQNYATRLYFYLPNPLYSGTQFHPYCGNGLATTWLLCWRPIGWMRLEMRYTFTYFIEDLSKKEAAKTDRSGPCKHGGVIQLLIHF